MSEDAKKDTTHMVLTTRQHALVAMFQHVGEVMCQLEGDDKLQTQAKLLCSYGMSFGGPDGKKAQSKDEAKELIDKAAEQARNFLDLAFEPVQQMAAQLQKNWAEQDGTRTDN